MFKTKMNILTSLVLTCMLIFSGCNANDKPQKEDSASTKTLVDLSVYKNGDLFITPQQLHEMIGDENLIIFDANKPDVYEKGHIPGALGVGFHTFSNTEGKPGDPYWGTTLDKEQLKAKLESYGVTKEKTVVFYSDVLPGPGPDGRNVWQMRMAGLENVKLLYGGFPKWKELGYEVTDEVSLDPIASKGIEVKDFDESYRASKEYIYENIDKTVIIDVRSEAEYKGSQKSGEARGGHITGSKFLLWSDVLNEDSTPKSPEEIIQIMGKMGVKPEDDFVVY